MRGRRPAGLRWTSPATKLQAARFARRWQADEVCARVRTECQGHSGRTCKMASSKLSEYETGKFRPTLQHVEVFCRIYGVGPEELGLITWRNSEEDHREQHECAPRIEAELHIDLATAPFEPSRSWLIWF